jgi:hypothetical protein
MVMPQPEPYDTHLAMRLALSLLVMIFSFVVFSLAVSYLSYSVFVSTVDSDTCDESNQEYNLQNCEDDILFGSIVLFIGFCISSIVMILGSIAVIYKIGVDVVSIGVYRGNFSLNKQKL